MYRKLCKYEFKSIGRTLLPIYLAVIVVSIINAFSMSVSQQFTDGFAFSSGGALQDILGLLQVVFVFAYFALLCALFVLTLVIIIQRFYKGLLCDEGYLMFTLPVKTWHLIASKATAALVMSILSAIAAMISIFILATGAMSDPANFLFSLINPKNWAMFFYDASTVSPLWPLYALELLALLIVGALASLFHIYVSLALGHLFKKHRILLAIVAYIVISMALSFLSGMGLIVLGSWLEFVVVLPLTGNAAAQLVIGGMLVWSLLQLVAFFIGTERILSKKLNLE